VVWVGPTTAEDAGVADTPLSVTSFAPSTTHESVVVWPAVMVPGFAVNDSMGFELGGGGQGRRTHQQRAQQRGLKDV